MTPHRPPPGIPVHLLEREVLTELAAAQRRRG